jgi:quercetin dioxygenase-like cupin family protein
LTVLQGSMEVEVDGSKRKLKLGGTARYNADRSHAIRNTGKTDARALLVVIHRS